MDKLKNLVNPGSKKDDEVMYGSGRSDDPVHTGHINMGGSNTASGQGNHFGGSRIAGQDPLSTSANPTGTSQYGTASAGGASHGLSEPYASRMPGGFDDDDAATTASVSSGIPGQSQSRSAMTGANDVYSSNNEPPYTEKPLPCEPASETGIGHADRSVENKPRYEGQPVSSHLGRDAALGAGAVGISAHRHEEPQKDNYATETDRSFPLRGSSTSDKYGYTAESPHSSNLANKANPRIDSDGSHISSNTGYGSSSTNYRPGTGATPSPGDQSSPSRDSLGAGEGAIGSASTADTGNGPEIWQHEHQRHGHQYEGDPCETSVGGQEGPHVVPGPHVTDTANRLDPHVNSGFGGRATTGESSGHHQHGQFGKRGEEAALAGGAGTAVLGALETGHGKHGTTGSTTSSGVDPSNTDRHGLNDTGAGAYDDNRSHSKGVSSTDRTAGPHKSDMLNKLDPRVDSDLSKQQGSHGSDHHPRRDAALTGAGGAGMYEAEGHHRGNESNLATSTATSAPGVGFQSPYGSGVDTHVNATRSKDESAISSAGSGHQPAISDHCYKRDAGLVGAGGIGAYEVEKHLGSSGRSSLEPTPQDRLAGSGHQPAIATNPSPYPSSNYSDVGQPRPGSHTERNPLAAGAVGAGATGGGDREQNTRDYGRNGSESQLREQQHPGASMATVPSTDYGNERYQDTSQGHHSGRDAGFVGGAGAGAAPHEETRHGHHPPRHIAATGGPAAGADASAGHAHTQRDLAGNQRTLQEHHTGRDAAILGGAAGVGGLAEHEYSKKDAAKSQKEHVKEEKALEKEHSKEVKQHNKELAKEEKAHDKAIDKAEKKHEKAMEKDEKKHEKGLEKDEAKQEHGGKKHGGLLGFLHRDKPDRELKEEEARRQGAPHTGHGEGEMATGEGATGLESRSGYDPLQGEHGSQSGVHDTPIGIGSGLTTHDAYGAHDSGHNRLHKDPPSKVVESRGYDLQ